MMWQLSVLVAIVAAGETPASSAAEIRPQQDSDRAAAAEAPTLDELIAQLAQSEQRIRQLSAEYTRESELHFRGVERLPRGMIEDDAVLSVSSAEIRWELDDAGRGRCEAVKRITHISADNRETRRTIEYLSTFDGERGLWLTSHRSPEGRLISRRGSGGNSAHHPAAETPLNFVTHYQGRPVSQWLREKQARVVGQRRWQDRPVVLVETAVTRVREDYLYKLQFWIDPSRRLAVRRLNLVQRGPDAPWKTHRQIDSLRHQQQGGVWLPEFVRSQYFNVLARGEPRLVANHQLVFSRWRINHPIAAERFRQTFPQDTDVQRQP